MEKIIYLLVGAALTWVFYFVHRRVERRGAVEAIERNQKLLDLKQGLDSANTNLDDLRRFEQRLIGKAETAARIADNYFTKAEEVARQSDDAAVTQADMNQQAAGEFQRADARLATVVAHLRRQLDGESLAVFDEAHRSWLAFPRALRAVRLAVVLGRCDPAADPCGHAGKRHRAVDQRAGDAAGGRVGVSRVRRQHGVTLCRSRRVQPDARPPMPITPHDVLAFWRDAGYQRWFSRDEAFDARCRDESAGSTPPRRPARTRRLDGHAPTARWRW